MSCHPLLLLTAAENGRFEDVKRRLIEGADVNWQNSNDETALMMRACAAGHVRVAELLIDREADLDWPNMYGCMYGLDLGSSGPLFIMCQTRPGLRR